MFDIGWSELVVIAVVALIAIGPKELPGVLRMVGQWMGKARRMASEFQGQFNEAMREAEMADLKKSFDEIKETASDLASNNIMTSLQKDVGEALKVDDIDLSLNSPTTTPEPPTPTTLADAEAHAQTIGTASEPLAITREAQIVSAELPPADVAHPETTKADVQNAVAASSDVQKDVKAS
jgi:sec-independent protein translocase protein TatB